MSGLTKEEEQHKSIAVGHLKEAIKHLVSAEAVLSHIPAILSIDRFLNEVTRLVRTVVDWIAVEL